MFQVLRVCVQDRSKSDFNFVLLLLFCLNEFVALLYFQVQKIKNNVFGNEEITAFSP
jgi:hypothetical protein